jgi:hypothetical protein
MRKMRLDLERLQVGAFDPDLQEPEREAPCSRMPATLDPRSCGGTCKLTQICGCGTCDWNTGAKTWICPE